MYNVQMFHQRTLMKVLFAAVLALELFTLTTFQFQMPAQAGFTLIFFTTIVRAKEHVFRCDMSFGRSFLTLKQNHTRAVISTGDLFKYIIRLSDKPVAISKVNTIKIALQFLLIRNVTYWMCRRFFTFHLEIVKEVAE